MHIKTGLTHGTRQQWTGNDSHVSTACINKGFEYQALFLPAKLQRGSEGLAEIGRVEIAAVRNRSTTAKAADFSHLPASLKELFVPGLG
jgi:hypothetical protein